MQRSTLSDLDELVLTVRDRNSRAYIAEALNAYRAQAHRAAIVATWIAVVYDIISKCRELANQNDSEAKRLIALLDTAIDQHEKGDGTAVQKLQRIENEALDKARDQFEFLSYQEHVDLSRLKEDRNLCAHPAFIKQDLLFQPTPELVRAHITHAVLHLLQQPPVQGKSALVRLKQDLLQPSFPTDSASVRLFLESKYLNHIKPALLENFITVFLKVLFKDNDAELRGREATLLRCLAAIQQHSRDVYDTVMSTQVPTLAETLSDPELVHIVKLFETEPRAWNWLSQSLKMRLQTLVEALSFSGEESDGVYLRGGMAIPELRPRLVTTIRRLKPSEQEQLLSLNPHPDLKDIAINLFANSKGFRTAESRFRDLLLPLSDTFDIQDIQYITSAIGQNAQIYEAIESPTLVLELFRRTNRLHPITKTIWEGMMTKLRAKMMSFDGLERAMTDAGMTVPPKPTPKWNA